MRTRARSCLLKVIQSVNYFRTYASVHMCRRYDCPVRTQVPTHHKPIAETQVIRWEYTGLWKLLLARGLAIKIKPLFLLLCFALTCTVTLICLICFLCSYCSYLSSRFADSKFHRNFHIKFPSQIISRHFLCSTIYEHNNSQAHSSITFNIDSLCRQ